MRGQEKRRHGPAALLASGESSIGETDAMNRAVLFDADGTLVDSMANLRRVWEAWADHHQLDRDRVWECATRTMPLETFAEVAPNHDAAGCLALLHELEDEDALNGDYSAFPAAAGLLRELSPDDWAVVTGNYRHRTMTRFGRLGLPMPKVLIDASGVRRGKPDPEGYLAAAHALGRSPAACLVIEDSAAGIRAGLSAGMTVWSVNAVTGAGAHRRYEALEAAALDIQTWLAEC
jgi:sugar-phosphatase